VHSEGRKQIVIAELPPRGQIFVGGGTQIDGEALFYIYRGDAVVAFQREAIFFDGLPRNLVLHPIPLSFGQSFELKPGHYTAKVIIRFLGYDEMGFARADFDVK
jgi:hypothetical protein